MPVGDIAFALPQYGDLGIVEAKIFLLRFNIEQQALARFGKILRFVMCIGIFVDVDGKTDIGKARQKDTGLYALLIGVMVVGDETLVDAEARSGRDFVGRA